MSSMTIPDITATISRLMFIQRSAICPQMMIIFQVFHIRINRAICFSDMAFKYETHSDEILKIYSGKYISNYLNIRQLQICTTLTS